MTSFIIDAHMNRSMPEAWLKDPTCVFCRIIDKELGAAVVYETENVIAILDILPLRKGHTLIIPKVHVARLSELPSEYAAATGEAISKVAHALTKALDHTGLNVVCNQEYAQIVPHVHYHIIPAPQLNKSTIDEDAAHREPNSLSHAEMHRIERAAREELDDEVAQELVIQVKAHL